MLFRSMLMMCILYLYYLGCTMIIILIISMMSRGLSKDGVKEGALVVPSSFFFHTLILGLSLSLVFASISFAKKIFFVFLIKIKWKLFLFFKKLYKLRVPDLYGSNHPKGDAHTHIHTCTPSLCLHTHVQGDLFNHTHL